MHEGAERWDEAGAALEKAAANAAAPAEIAEIQFRNAQILQRKEAEPVEVERALLRALDADPTHRGTLTALEKMARESKDDERLVQLLELALESVADDEERRRLLREIARLYAGPLGHPAAALPHLERLVALDPNEIAGREQLAEVLAGAGRAREAAQLMGQLIEQLTKARRGKDAARWHTRLGTLTEASGDFAGAAKSFGAAYKLDPSHPATVAALGRLAFRSGDHDGARKYYRSLLLQNFDPRDGRRLEGRGLPDARPHAPAGQRDPEGPQHVRARPRGRTAKRRPQSRADRHELTRAPPRSACPHPEPSPASRARVTRAS